MKRRRLLLAGGAVLAAKAATGFSQERRRKIGVVHPTSPGVAPVSLASFRQELRRLGYREDTDFVLEVQWAEGRTDELPRLAAEIVASGPDVILTASSAGVAACKKATSTIPIVFATASNPVEQGFVASLQRPGGNITGVILYADRMTQKVVEMTREMLPSAKRLGLLLHEPDPVSRFELAAFDAAARNTRFEPAVVRMRNAGDFERAFDEVARLKVDALVIPQLAFFLSHRREVAQRAVKARLPLVGSDLRYVDAGAVLGYGTMVEENYRRAAVMVDKILRGAKPGEMPVEQPERYRLVLNMKTANAIALTFPKVTQMRADRIIE
jgi:putative tryptophan/tyrosine transport system substrate-binding protein